VGIDTVVGANLAVSLTDRMRVVGLGLQESVTLPDCETGYCPGEDSETVRHWVASTRPQRIVYCGPAARSHWQEPKAAQPGLQAVAAAERWAKAASEFDSLFTLISTDAVFTGPWIFHTEESNCLCPSPSARRIRSLEKACRKICPQGLFIRTHVFGWSSRDGWIERTLNDLDTGIAGPFDYQRHATPILATDFVETLEQAWQAELEGVYHVGGGERLNPNQFAVRLADEFGLPRPLPVNGNSLPIRPTGFGRGETSLHSTRIRKALGLAPPTLADALQRLREQRHNGYCDHLKSAAACEKVA